MYGWILSLIYLTSVVAYSVAAALWSSLCSPGYSWFFLPEAAPSVSVYVCVRLTLLWLCSRIPLSAASGGSLQQLSEVMFKDSGVQLLTLTPQHTAGHLSAVKIHKLSPAHCAKGRETQRGRDYNQVYWGRTLVLVWAVVKQQKFTGGCNVLVCAELNSGKKAMLSWLKTKELHHVLIILMRFIYPFDWLTNVLRHLDWGLWGILNFFCWRRKYYSTCEI